MKTLKLILLFTVSAYTFTSCKKDTSVTSNPSQLQTQSFENSYKISGNGLNDYYVNSDGEYYNSGYKVIKNGIISTELEAHNLSKHQGFTVKFFGDAIGAYSSSNQNTIVGCFIDDGSIKIYADTGMYYKQNIKVIIDEYNSIGDYIRGTFSGTFKGRDGIIYTVTEGKINLLRASDYQY